MDWQIKPLARECAVSGEPFEIGDEVICFLYRDEEGQLQRADVATSKVDDFPRPEAVLGRWGREVKPRGEDEREARAHALATTEELFLSLFESDSADVAEDRELFKQVLGLMLERKRILRSQGRPVDGQQSYLHVRSKVLYSVQSSDPDPASLVRIQEELNSLVF
ncbi:hypothetical protein [Cerasicoccus arenae]|uniref:Uncharacterized protein n=1 Tax=Cerasicoccus arenae TaxID=424488 RepID=A0A8J3GDV7_9BACT|nr:hypothetical protein [Cerasicoccus arenae]MBK1858722.1 hypothetical protein [Cerasicoccus arenae]GHB98506.1 hypothetical protein GCM10007047_13320 [Cerasicoccus arenae]